MLWIGLAVGSVIGLVVFVAIKLFTWVDARLALRRSELEPRQLSSHGQSGEEVVRRERLDAVLASVDAIKQEMGEKRTDVVWTITNSALWDVAVPSSKRFFTALTIWDDHHHGWTANEAVAAAAELKVLWRAALETATRLGINHLSAHDRPKADTAIKLVRKATSTPSDAERHQLMAKAAQVLSGIMSISIPRETMRELESGATRPALPDVPHEPPGAGTD